MFLEYTLETLADGVVTVNHHGPLANTSISKAFIINYDDVILQVVDITLITTITPVSSLKDQICSPAIFGTLREDIDLLGATASRTLLTSRTSWDEPVFQYPV